MKTSNIIETHGTITKKESLSAVGYKIIENTCVAEAQHPYADYYGVVPKSSSPNSLYLFTKHFYTLDEVLKITCDMKEFFGYTKKLDVATAIIDCIDHYQYAIRVRDFPDYEHIHWMQSCYSSEGIAFSRKIQLIEPVRLTVFKSFKLGKLEEGSYLDMNNPHKGYITIPRQIKIDEFAELLINFRNNNECELFDAAIGTFEINSKTINMIRIYTENIKNERMKCAKEKFTDYLLKVGQLEH